MAKEKFLVGMIDPKTIAFNPENVRAESEEQIESDENFLRLKESVGKIGVLVPLVVKEQHGKDKKFLLIDGERRLRAALATNQELVPVHIPPKEKVKNATLLSFQIHTLREQWTRTAQARALEKIIKKIKEDSDKKGEELFNEVSEKTGYKESKLRDLTRVLKYVKVDSNILDEIEEGKSNVKFSHLVQLEASFIEQLKRTFPDIIQDYGLKTIREKLLEKVRTEIISSTREPIDKLLPLFVNAKTTDQLNYLKILIREFIDVSKTTPESIFRKYELKFPAAKEDLLNSVEIATRKIEEVEAIMNNVKYQKFGIYQELKRTLVDKIDHLITALRDAKRRIK